MTIRRLLEVQLGTDSGLVQRRVASLAVAQAESFAGFFVPRLWWRGAARTTEPVDPFFGARYRVLLQPESPALSGTTVSVTVSYGGCRNNHGFVLRHRIQMDVAEIWLRKTTPDESCDMLVTERRVFTIPGRANSYSVTLIVPDVDPYHAQGAPSRPLERSCIVAFLAIRKIIAS